MIDDLLPTKSKRLQLLDSLEEILDDDPLGMSDDSDEYTARPSMAFTKKCSKKPIDDYDEADEWFASIADSVHFKLGKPSRGSSAESIMKTGKKGKKKKKGDAESQEVDYDKEFSAEAKLLANLLTENNRYVDSLQRTYDHMVQTKSTSRGVTKGATDMMANLTSARSLSLQITKEMASIRKTVQDFKLKQRKDSLSAVAGMDDIGDFTANLLKKMSAEREAFIIGNDANVAEYDADEMASVIDEHLESGVENLDTRSAESDAYLKYENAGIEVRVSVNSNDESDYEYVAYDTNGAVVEDYPLPNKNTLKINRSTNVATDVYGQKYQVDWV